jgi:hypothetical protein
MSKSRRRSALVLGGFTLSFLLVACGDIATAPDRMPVNGPRALRDDGPPAINWADTLDCYRGWVVVNYLIECDPT